MVFNLPRLLISVKALLHCGPRWYFFFYLLAWVNKQRKKATNKIQRLSIPFSYIETHGQNGWLVLYSLNLKMWTKQLLRGARKTESLHFSRQVLCCWREFKNLLSKAASNIRCLVIICSFLCNLRPDPPTVVNSVTSCSVFFFISMLRNVFLVVLLYLKSIKTIIFVQSSV